METVLLFLAGMALAALVTAVTLVALGVRAIRRANRVSPSVRTPAPTAWLFSPCRAARYHRRLRRIVATSRACTLDDPSGLGLAGLAGELEGHACELDAQLVVAHRSPATTRSRLLRELGAELAEVEALGERIVRLSRAWSGTRPSVQGVVHVRERLDALEAALRELDGVERLPTLEAPRRGAAAPVRTPPRPARPADG